MVSFDASADPRFNYDGEQRGNLGDNGREPKGGTGKPFLTRDLSESLDLVPFVEKLAAHAGTHRCRRAILSLVAQQERYSGKRRTGQASKELLSKRRRFMVDLMTADVGGNLSTRQTNAPSPAKRAPVFQVAIAASPEEARREYERVEQALLALQGNIDNVTFPPHYGYESGPFDVETAVDTDDDEWLDFASPTEYTLEHILQAEQVASTLLGVHEWAASENSRTWMPLLSDIGTRIDDDSLLSLLEKLRNSVEIVRVRSLTDPGARASYQFQLNGTTFPELAELRSIEEGLLNRRKQKALSRKPSKPVDRAYASIGEELLEKQSEIQLDLSRCILRNRNKIDVGLDLVAELDLLFCKAAFAVTTNGRVPVVKSEGRISVNMFLHPLLVGRSLEKKGSLSTDPVPIDLKISSGDDANATKKGLVISGMNGGGKTFALKSFGLVCFLCRLGIPIPTLDAYPPRVDFFDDILTSVGDRQDLTRGESTFTSKLNTYSQILAKVQDKDEGDEALKASLLVLLDELGSGTDADAGGSIGQAILEKLLETDTSRVVATTHSPRLKAFSFDCDKLQCAAVLASKDALSAYDRPSFQLQYGVIGDSYAFGAVSRCTPALPSDVLSRVSDLMFASKEDPKSDYVRALSSSLERQVYMAKEELRETERAAKGKVRCQKAMVSLAEAYVRHLSLLEDRLESCYRDLRQNAAPLAVVGDSLKEVRLVKKNIASDVDLLLERGLKVPSDSYGLKDGELVVVIAEGEWNGVSCTVVSSKSYPRALSPDEVLVVPSFSPLGDAVISSEHLDSSGENSGEIPMASALLLKRYQVAVWDYDSVWDEAKGESKQRVTSVSDTKRRLYDVLASLSTPNPATSSRRSSTDRSSGEGDSSVPPTKFLSARERRAANSGNANRKKKKRR